VTLLLDTHTLLWWWNRQARLGKRARATISDPSQRVLVSAASCWEIAIKRALGKLDWARSGLAVHIADDGFEELPITAENGEAAGALPLHHRDPFDRMLIAQAIAERAQLVTADRRLEAYGVPVLRADE